jgi:peptidoglycan/xylan/chitin deacetylase (PgdA/CDA1 family)
MGRITELSRAIREADAIRWAAAAVILLAGLALAGHPIAASPLLVVAVVPWAGFTAFGVRQLVRDSRPAAILGLTLVVLGAWLLRYASYPGSGYVVANVVGAGAGLLVPRGLPRPFTLNLALIGSGLGILAALRWLFGTGGAEVAAIALAAAGAGAAFNASTGGSGRRTLLAGLVMLAYAGFAVFWVGSTSPSVEWFGELTSHGPRTGNKVAITFDDGPNPPYTEQIAKVLEDYGARGTFFEVGKAVVKAPETTRKLFQSGHLIGNHSYNHGAFSYLDPGYPELAQTQRTFLDQARFCPAVFRPPHGTHTPFMSRVVTGAGLRLVTWDVSAKDWTEHDPAALARNILTKVRPGSIILLHDGIDGNIGADRSVVVEALPLIMEGLKAKGFEAVRLDVLLGFAPAIKC